MPATLVQIINGIACQTCCLHLVLQTQSAAHADTCLRSAVLHSVLCAEQFAAVLQVLVLARQVQAQHALRLFEPRSGAV